MSLHPPRHHDVPQSEALLSYEAAGKLLAVTARTIWTLVDQGQLPRVQFGRSVRIDPADLRAFIASRKNTGHDQARQRGMDGQGGDL